MNRKLVQDIIKMDNNADVIRALNDRRSYILAALADRVAEPTDELMRELSEINIALGDFPTFTDGEQ